MGVFDRLKKQKWQHEDYEIRIEGLKEIDSDLELLSKIAFEDPHWQVRLNAARLIHNKDILANIAINDSFTPIREYCISQIEDEDVLYKLFLNEKDTSLKETIAEKIYDADILKMMDSMDNDEKVEKIITTRRQKKVTYITDKTL